MSVNYDVTHHYLRNVGSYVKNYNNHFFFLYTFFQICKFMYGYVHTHTHMAHTYFHNNHVFTNFFPFFRSCYSENFCFPFTLYSVCQYKPDET